MKDRVKAKQLLIPVLAREMEKINYKQYKNTPVFYRSETCSFGESYRIVHPIPEMRLDSNMLYDEWVIKLSLEIGNDVNMETISQNWTYYWVQLKDNERLEDYLIPTVLSFYTQIGYYTGIKRIAKKINREETLKVLYK